MSTPFRKTKLGKFIRDSRGRGFRLRKEIYQRCFWDRSAPKKVLLIFGCQRSGTTMLGYVLAKDPRTAVLQEQSCLTREDSLRLRETDEINRLVTTFHAPLIVVKPIVESQRADKLLSEVTNSTAVWMFRHYRDVVSSNVRRFRSQIEGLRSVVTGTRNSWRNERVSESTMAILKRFYRDDMARADAAALGWYSRNALFFELELDQHPGVHLFRYEHLVTEPKKAMRQLYEFWGVGYPKRDITAAVDQASLGKGGGEPIGDEIAELCDGLAARLETHWAGRNEKRTQGQDVVETGH